MTEAGRDGEMLAPIRIFTSEIELDGFVATAGQRITDILLRGQDLAFLPRGAEALPEHWISVSPAEILIAAPPPLPPRAPWRTRQEKRRVAVRVGSYSVTGTAHLHPGCSIAEVSARQSFVPLTDAQLNRDADGGERYSVLIVNLSRAAVASSPGRE